MTSPLAIAEAASGVRLPTRDPEPVRIVRDVLERGSRTTLGDAGAIDTAALAARKARGGMSRSSPA